MIKHGHRCYSILMLVFVHCWWQLCSYQTRHTLMIVLATQGVPYIQDQSSDYVNGFPAIMSQSYSMVSDERRVPSGLLQSCVGRGKVVSSSLKEDSSVVVTVPRGNQPSDVVMANQVQQQCGTTHVCILEGSIMMLMDAPLHVYALVIRNGSTLLWNDQTQSNHQHIWLCAGYIAIEVGGIFNLTLTGQGGRLPTNTTQQLNMSHPSYHNNNNYVRDKYAWLYITNNGAEHPMLRTRVLGAVGNRNPDDIQPIIQIQGRGMARTWSLLQENLPVGQQYLSLMHDPVAMGWRYQDRIAIAPTAPGSTGYGQNFSITGLNAELGIVYLDRASMYNHDASMLVHGDTAYLESAEVINLSRNVIVTGDDYEEIPCDSSLPEAVPGEQTSSVGCRCAKFRTSCTVGLHTVHMYGGVSQIDNVRIEKCGQRGIEGKYCFHLHHLQDCPTCRFSNNAVEVSQQRGLVVHGTHRSEVSSNVFYDVRGANIYLEDGNEMLNTLAYNVAICPWPRAVGGCTIPGTSNDQSDTSINQSGLYMRSPNNHLIGNRMANHFNAMFVDATDSGRGLAFGNVCPNRVPFGVWQGNTLHSSGRFGTYALTNNYPLRSTGQSVTTNGYTTAGHECEYFDSMGYDLGFPVAVRNNFDYGNAFVGHYQAGDIQYQNHFSHNNLNLLYWKETKSFADGCSSHISHSYLDGGNLGVSNVALPDSLGSFILEHTTIVNATLEANHHCGVGTTGILCMPNYILHNVTFIMHDPLRPWVTFNESNNAGGGAIFSLSPASTEITRESEQMSFFPQGYTSLVSNQFPWLLLTGLCNSSSSLGLNVRYQDGILCKCQLRAFKIYTKGMESGTSTDLHLKMWKREQYHENQIPLAEAYIPFRMKTAEKQGYAVPIIPGADFFYSISLAGGIGIASDWILDFSDQTIANRWGVEYLFVDVKGRNCGPFVPSNHDRLFLAGNPIKAPNSAAWVHGACTDHNETPIKICTGGKLTNNGSDSSYECSNSCSRDCGTGGYCDCSSRQCRCYVGWSGSFCEINLCATASCVHGACTMTFLGSNLSVQASPCACEHGWTGQFCDQVTSTTEGVLQVATTAPSQPSTLEQQSCRGYCVGEWPFGCATNVSGSRSLMCHPNGGCYYASSSDDRGPFPGFCVYKGDQALGDQSNCVEECSGIVHLGCKSDLVGVIKYLCNSTFGCYYATKQQDNGPFPGFCAFLQYKIPSTMSPTKPLPSTKWPAKTVASSIPFVSVIAPKKQKSSIYSEPPFLGQATPAASQPLAKQASHSPSVHLATAQKGNQSLASQAKAWSTISLLLLVLLSAQMI